MTLLARENIHPEDRILLRSLFSRDELSLYSLHEQFRLSTAQLARLLDKYVAENIIEIDARDEDIFLRFSAVGRDWILKNEHWIIEGRSTMPWKSVPQHFQQERLDPKAPYEPDETDIMQFSRGLARGGVSPR